jgi:hypothetical protein
MPHEVAMQVIRLLAGVTLGRPLHHPTGLTVLPILGPGARSDEPSLTSQVADLEVSESAPPSAGRLLVANRGHGAVAVRTGDLFVAGLADRAARAAVVVRPRTEQVVDVEAMEARWWWQGPLVLAGALDPPRSALIALTGLARDVAGGLSAIARTCLWALGEGIGGGEPPAEVDGASSTVAQGWVLLADRRVAAVRMWGRPRRMALRGAVRAAAPHGEEAAARRFLADLGGAAWTQLHAGVAEGAIGGLRIRLAQLDGEIVELSAVLLTADLAGALLRGRPSP